MKNLYFIIILILLGSCSDDFININPASDSSTSAFYNNASDIEQAITAAYDPLQQLYESNGLDHFLEVRSDNTYNDNTTQGGGSRANFDNFNLASSNFMLNDAWTNSYLGIQRANIVLNRIDAIEDMDPSLITIRKGEMMFLRALYYFNIVRIWGDAPLVLTETVDPFEGFEHTRDGVNEIYTQILSDLQSAASSLSGSGATEAGRATKGAALALLGKVQLTRGQFSKATGTLEKVISGGDYSLLSVFADVFRVDNQNNNESIFEVQFKSGTNGEGHQATEPTQDQDVNNRPSPNVMAFFDANRDDRFDASVDTTATGQNYYSAKQVSPRGTDGTYDFNSIVLRYADVLLMAAESLNEVGYNQGNAFFYINQVRQRANATPYTTADLPDQDSFRQAISDERRLELAFENHRWFDLVSTGQALAVMNAANGGELDPNGGSALPFSIAAHQLLFPIPLAQIDASSGAFTQNDGY